MGTRETHSLRTSCRATATLVVLLTSLLALVACGGSGTSTGSSTRPDSSPPTAEASPATAARPGTIAFTRVLSTSVRGGDLELRTDIYTVRSDGTGLTRLTRTGDCSAPAWSPDGRRLAYIRSRAGSPPGSGVWVMDVGEGGRRFVTLGVESLGPGLAWSPGEKIAYPVVKAEDKVVLFAVDPVTKWATRVTPRVAPATVDTYPAWAPNGGIYFIRSTSDKEPARICSIAVAGSAPAVVLQAPQPATFSLSPDGSLLLLWDRTRDALVRLPTDGVGGETMVLGRLSHYVGRTLAVSTSWSPDGRRIAFASGMWPASGLFMCSDSGSDVTEVRGVGKVFGPAWRPE